MRVLSCDPHQPSACSSFDHRNACALHPALADERKAQGDLQEFRKQACFLRSWSSARSITAVWHVASPPALWDSEGRSRNPFRFERFMPSPVRVLTTVSSVMLLSLLSVSFADAAQTPRRGTPGKLCDAQSTTLKRIVRHSKKLGGPRRLQPPAALVELSDTTARWQRSTHTDVDSDDAAIQNDAPAARTEADDSPVPALRPLGLLIRSLDIRPVSRAFCPRSPRGPPPVA
jgi:hypothetical protein